MCFDFTHSPLGIELPLRLLPGSLVQLWLSCLKVASRLLDRNISVCMCVKVKALRVICKRKIYHVQSSYTTCWKLTISGCVNGFILRSCQFAFCNLSLQVRNLHFICLMLLGTFLTLANTAGIQVLFKNTKTVKLLLKQNKTKRQKVFILMENWKHVFYSSQPAEHPLKIYKQRGGLHTNRACTPMSVVLWMQLFHY